MATELKDQGVTITYQGKICYPQFQYNRSAGLEPDFGWVALYRDDFKDFVVRESMPGVDLLDASDGGGASTGLKSAGELVLKERVDENEFIAKWDFVLVSERAAQVVVADDDDKTEVVRIELTDIRYLWKNRGEVVGWINIPIARPSGSDQTPGKTIDRGTPQYITGSMDPDNGQPWTLDRVLRAKVLPNLPGKPQLVLQPDQKADHFAKIVGPKQWDGILAKDALQQLVDEFQLVFVLNPGKQADQQGNDCPSVSVWQENDGGLRVQDYSQGGSGSVSPSSTPYEIKNFLPVEKGVANQSCDPRIANARQSCGFKHIPPVCVVRGAPTIQAARVPLEPVGINSLGRVVPLAEALADIGLDEARACKFALLPKEERSALLGVTEEGLKAFDLWAFKMFRLPGGPDQNAARLPILDATVEVDAVGQKVPIRVYSEGHTVVRRLDLLNSGTATGAIAKASVLQKDLEDINKRITSTVNTKTGTAALSVDEYTTLFAKQTELQGQIDELLSFATSQLAASNPDLKSALARLDIVNSLNGSASSTFGGLIPGRLELLTKAQAELDAARKKANASAQGQVQIAFASVAGSQIQQSSLNKHLRVVVNIPFGFAASSGYDVNRDLGIVTFHEVQGNVVAAGVALAEASLKPINLISVELEFAYRLKPSGSEDLSLDFRYSYVLVRKPDGTLETRTAVPSGVAPLRVFRPELQLIRNLDGSTNKETLDAIARKLAEQQLTGLRSTPGAIVEFNRPISILNTGACLSVTTSYGTDEIPGVQAHLSNYARFAPVGNHLRTRGLGGQGGLDDLDGGTLHGSIAPRGPRR